MVAEGGSRGLRAPSADGRDAVVGWYELDGQPMFLTLDGWLVTADGRRVEWGEWLYRARSIPKEEYDALLCAPR